MIKNFKEFLNENRSVTDSRETLNEFQLYILDNFVSGTWKINEEGLIDIDGRFSSGHQIGTGMPKFSKLARYIDDNNLPPFAGLRFGHVTDVFDINGSKIDSLGGIVKSAKSFYCNSNLLTSLEGAPTITDSFTCENNNLTSLKGAPTGKIGYFQCQGNQLENLEHGPAEVEGSYNCSRNLIRTLKGGPKRVGSFFCSNNQLESLEGGPEIIDKPELFNHSGSYNCQNNKLKTLQGSPSFCVQFNCSDNDLDSLEGSPQDIGSKNGNRKSEAGSFTCNNCNLTTLKGGPKEVFYLHCKDNRLLSLEGIYAIDINAGGNIISTATMKLVDRHMSKTGKSWTETLDELNEEIPDTDWNKIPSEIRNRLEHRGHVMGKKFGL